MELVLDAAEIGLWYCPLPFDRLEWDHRVKEHFWLPPDAAVSIDTFYDRLHPEDLEPTREAIAEAIATHGRYEVEYRTVCPADGRVKWIRAIGRAFYDEEGRAIMFDGLTMDVTGTRHAEAERERLLASERAARAEAERTGQIKDEFLATLSHELRTPLNAILGWTQILRTGRQPTQANLQEGLAAIERNARAQTQLVEDLLDMNRIISGKMRLELRLVDPVPVIEAAIDAVTPAAQITVCALISSPYFSFRDVGPISATDSPRRSSTLRSSRSYCAYFRKFSLNGGSTSWPISTRIIRAVSVASR